MDGERMVSPVAIDLSLMERREVEKMLEMDFDGR